MSAEAWPLLRSQLALGQRLHYIVLPAPWPAGVTGIFVGLHLAVVGFVDALLLPHGAGRWPVVGTETDFDIWWMDERPQIRLKPVDSAYLRDDFGAWAASFRGSA